MPLHAFRNQRSRQAEASTHCKEKSNEVEVVDEGSKETVCVLFADDGDDRAGWTNDVDLLDEEEVAEGNGKEAEGRLGNQPPVEHRIGQAGFNGLTRRRLISER